MECGQLLEEFSAENVTSFSVIENDDSELDFLSNLSSCSEIYIPRKLQR